MGRKRNVSLASTEPQARKVQEEIRRTRKPAPIKKKDTGGKTTATTPKGVQKTAEQAKKEKAALRKKINLRVKSKQRKIYEANNKK